eukprot:s803_g7.t4
MSRAVSSCFEFIARTLSNTDKEHVYIAAIAFQRENESATVEHAVAQNRKRRGQVYEKERQLRDPFNQDNAARGWYQRTTTATGKTITAGGGGPRVQAGYGRRVNPNANNFRGFKSKKRKSSLQAVHRIKQPNTRLREPAIFAGCRQRSSGLTGPRPAGIFRALAAARPRHRMASVPAMWRSASCEDFALMNTAPPDDVERSRMVKVIQGTWINVDCPAERYTVVGQHVTRSDVQGCRHFTLFWDPRRSQLQWGTQGRLYLACLGDGLVAWVPSRYSSRAWRWQRVTGMPPQLPPLWALPCQGLSPPVMRVPGPADHGFGYGPWRRPYGAALRSWGPGYAGRPTDFPRRSWNHGYGRSFHGNRNIQGMNLERDSRLACGLSSTEVFDLLFRDITPDDYETLLRLDESVDRSRSTASASCISSLKKVPGKDLVGEMCSVCLVAFDDNAVAAELPCGVRAAKPHQHCIPGIPVYFRLIFQVVPLRSDSFPCGCCSWGPTKWGSRFRGCPIGFAESSEAPLSLRLREQVAGRVPLRLPTLRRRHRHGKRRRQVRGVRQRRTFVGKVKCFNGSSLRVTTTAAFGRRCTLAFGDDDPHLWE